MSRYQNSSFPSEPREKIQEVDDQNDDIVDEAEAEQLFPMIAEATVDKHRPAIPDLFTQLPPIRDPLETDTSLLQDETIQECLPSLAGISDGDDGLQNINAHGLPRLERDRHIAYLHDSLTELPAIYVAYDASRPWIVYWALTGLCLLGEDVSGYCERVIQTFAPMQNPDGGYGSGHGQMSHIAPSYAAVLSLAMVGGPEALGSIDRRSLWRWLGKIKQPDGGFTVSQGGEEDVRGAYCALVLVSLLGLPTELPHDSLARSSGMGSLLDGLPEWLSQCQTYEGGIAGAPGTEAHGAYAFCALACLCILGSPREVLPKHLNLPLLTSWISSRQYAPEGGFAGRTNKLVDACYSHWVGGCWPLIEAASNIPKSMSAGNIQSNDSLYHHEGLIRYIMCCSQSSDGGFQDKPSKRADGYHSCYALAGLSSVQHHHQVRYDHREAGEGTLSAAFGWSHGEEEFFVGAQREERIYEIDDVLAPIHPIYVIPFGAVEKTRSWFLTRKGF